MIERFHLEYPDTDESTNKNDRRNDTMFDMKRRSGFQTIGELRTLLNNLPGSARVTICGDANCFFHVETDSSIVCFDCEDLNEHYEDALEKMLEAEAPVERDRHLESLWAELTDVPMDPETECMEAPFCFFSAGTHREDIWRWFDEHHSRGVSYLLNHSNPNAQPQDHPLSLFIQQEVPFRLKEILEIPPEQLSEELIHNCVEFLDNNTDILLNYDRIDEALRSVLPAHGIHEVA